jgi:hypothetical protein
MFCVVLFHFVLFDSVLFYSNSVCFILFYYVLFNSNYIIFRCNEILIPVLFCSIILYLIQCYSVTILFVFSILFCSFAFCSNYILFQLNSNSNYALFCFVPLCSVLFYSNYILLCSN